MAQQRMSGSERGARTLERRWEISEAKVGERAYDFRSHVVLYEPSKGSSSETWFRHIQFRCLLAFTTGVQDTIVGFVSIFRPIVPSLRNFRVFTSTTWVEDSYRLGTEPVNSRQRVFHECDRAKTNPEGLRLTGPSEKTTLGYPIS